MLFFVFHSLTPRYGPKDQPPPPQPDIYLSPHNRPILIYRSRGGGGNGRFLMAMGISDKGSAIKTLPPDGRLIEK
jgi:hypothetical protein